MKARGYPVRGADLMQIATLLHADLSRESYDVRIVPGAAMPTPHGAPAPPFAVPGTLGIEIRRPPSLVQQTTGQAAMLKVWLVPNAAGFQVHVGMDRWGDRAAGAVEWLLATPALVTEGYASFQRQQLDERVFRVVEHWLTTVARVPVNRAPAEVPQVGPCASCRTPMPFGARFCPRCGHDAQGAKVEAACPSCKGRVDLDAVFCPHCGKSVAKAPAPTCVKCKTALDAGAMFCSSCGARQDEAADGTSASTTSPRANDKAENAE